MSGVCCLLKGTFFLILNSFPGQESVVNLTAEDGASPLLIAAQEGHDSCIELLLAHGADPNITLKETKAAPVHYSIFKNRIR